MIFSLNYSDADFEAVLQRFVTATTQMKSDGWWWHSPEITNKSIRRSILKETLFR
jgi:glutamate-1-semialdehyde 2,1-aminomutase